MSRMKPDYEKVTTLLKDTITLLCKNGLAFDNEFSIDAVIGITLDKKDVFIVPINNVIKSEKPPAKDTTSEEDSDLSSKPDSLPRKRSRKRKMLNRIKQEEYHDSPLINTDWDQHSSTSQKQPEADDKPCQQELKIDNNSDSDPDILFIKQEVDDSALQLSGYDQSMLDSQAGVGEEQDVSTWSFSAQPQHELPGTSAGNGTFSKGGTQIFQEQEDLHSTCSSNEVDMKPFQSQESLQLRLSEDVQQISENRRFREVGDDTIDELTSSATAKATEYQTKWAVKNLKEWLLETGQNTEFECLEPSELDNLLARFYAAVQPSLIEKEQSASSKSYSKSSYFNIRSGLNRYLRLPPHNKALNLMKDQEFHRSNQVFVGILKCLRRAGNDFTKHRYEIAPEHISQIYSKVFNTDTPWGLLYKVFFEITLHIARRGRDSLRELHSDSFIFITDSSGREYVQAACMVENPKQGDEAAVMYSQPGHKHCPVASLKKYLLKRNTKCQAFYQYPVKNLDTSTSSCWYDNRPIGKNILGNLMQRISKEAALPVIYTNNCIRASALTALHHN